MARCLFIIGPVRDAAFQSTNAGAELLPADDDMNLRTVAALFFVLSLAAVGMDMHARLVTGETWFTLGAGVLVPVWLWFYAIKSDRIRKRYTDAASQRAARRAARKLPTSAPIDFEEVVTVVERNLTSAEYMVDRNVILPTGDTAALVASRIEFTLPGAVNFPAVHHVLLQHPKIGATVDFDTLFEAGFQHATGTHRSSFWRCERFMHIILPCIAVDRVTPELIAFASCRPPPRWMRFEFPVLYDIGTGQLYYYDEKTPVLGRMFFPSARALAESAFDVAGHAPGDGNGVTGESLEFRAQTTDMARNDLRW